MKNKARPFFGFAVVCFVLFGLASCCCSSDGLSKQKSKEKDNCGGFTEKAYKKSKL